MDENYDIPRSHQPYIRMPSISPGAFSSTTTLAALATSTPNLLTDGTASTTATGGVRRHVYTNAAPTNHENNVFRFDFDEQVSAHRLQLLYCI